MSSRRLRGLAPEIDPKTSPSRRSRAERHARRSRAIAKAEDARFQAVAADDAQMGNAATQEGHSSSQVAVLASAAAVHSQVAVRAHAAAKMPETNAGSHSEHTGELDSPHNSSKKHRQSHLPRTREIRLPEADKVWPRQTERGRL